MRCNGLGHCRGFAVMQRVITAHDPLQFRKLADHAGDQVGLGQPGGAFGLRRIGIQQARDFPGQQLHAFDALQLCAEFIVINDFCQPRHTGFQPFFAILVVEKPGIFQPRTDHALVAADDVRRVGNLHIADDQKTIGQFSGTIEQRKVFLVLTHGQDQAFGGYFEKIRIESADIHRRMFDQRRDFIQQILVFAHCRLLFFGFRLQQFVNHGAALGEIGDDHAVFGQHGFVGLGIGDHQLGLPHKTMAAGFIARGDAEHGARQDGCAVQHDQAMCGAHKFRVAVAPAHHFGDGQFFQCGFDFCGEVRLQSAASGGFTAGEYRALGRFDLDEVFDRDAVFPGEAGQCRRRFAVFVEPDLD